MHKYLIEKIISEGSPAQMRELKEVMIESICKLDEKDYKETELELHEIVYGEHLGEYLAKKWVSSMENKDGTKGGHWTVEQTESVRRQYAPKMDSNDWYAVLNMMYSDYYNPKFDTSDYIELAKDWLNDKDIGEEKTLKYYYYIADCEK